IDFISSAEITGEVVNGPRSGALYQNDGIDGPAVQELALSLFPWKQVGHRSREMMPDVEHTVPIDRFLTRAVDGNDVAPIVIILSQGMGVGVTQHERETVRLALRQGNLQGIVIGDVAILQIIDKVQIRKLRVVRLGGNFGRSVWGAVVIAGGSAGQTLSSSAVGIGRIPPTGAESA